MAVGFLGLLYLLSRICAGLPKHTAIFSPVWFLCILLREEGCVQVQALQLCSKGPTSQPVSKDTLSVPWMCNLKELVLRPSSAGSLKCRWASGGTQESVCFVLLGHLGIQIICYHLILFLLPAGKFLSPALCQSGTLFPMPCETDSP